MRRSGFDETYRYHDNAGEPYFTKRLSCGYTVGIVPEGSWTVPWLVRIDPGLESGLNVIRYVPYKRAADVVAVLEQLFGEELICI